MVELGILSLAVFWAWTWARAPRRELRLTALDALVAVFLFWSLFSVPFAPYYHAAEAAALAIVCFAALYWCLSFNPSFAGLSTALLAARIQASLQAVLVLAAAIGGRDRPAGTFVNPNFLAGFLAATLLLVIGALVFPSPVDDGRRRWRTALAVGEGALLLAALVATGSRGGALALAAGLLLLLVLRSWKVAVGVFAAAAFALLAIPNPLVQRLQSLPHTDSFAFTRLSVWKSAALMLADHPWLGIGLGQYEYVSTRYAFPVTTHWAKYTRVAENAHSEYLQAGAELGLPGILAALGAVALLAQAAIRRLRRLPRVSWGPVVTLLAAILSILVQAAVDFPLHTPPATLLLVLLAAGLRLHGVIGPERAVSFRVRPLYAAAAALIAVLLGAAAVRPVLGFWFFLGGIGAPRNLLNEKWSFEQAPRSERSHAETLRMLGLAARIDFVNAPYRRALGGYLFQAYQRGEGGPELLQQSLYHLNLAAELNPSQYQYAVNLAEAMTTLARRAPPGRELLQAALEHYRRAVRLAPFRFGVYSEIGLLCDEVGDTPAAEAAFRRAVAIEEYYLRGWLDLGKFYARHGRLPEARETFSRGAALAEKAPGLVPTTPAESALLALKPEFFYNELRKLELQEHPGGSTS